MVAGVPTGRGHGEPVGDHLAAFGAIAIVIDSVGAVTHRAQQRVAAGAGHAPGEEILTAIMADIGIVVDFHTPSDGETRFLFRYPRLKETAGRTMVRKKHLPEPDRQNAGTFRPIILTFQMLL